MYPGDQVYTLEEFRCWKVENLRLYWTMGGLMKTGTKEELATLCFSVCRLNLPLVPSLYDVLQDNKRCYNKINKKKMTGILDHRLVKNII